MKKSAVVHFRKNGYRSDFMFNLNKNILQYSEEYKYLGVIFHEKINFHKKADPLSKAGGRALGGMVSEIRSYKEIGISTFKNLFLNCVDLVLDYCSEVWGLRNYHCIEMDQNRALRNYLGVHRFTPLPAFKGKLDGTHVTTPPQTLCERGYICNRLLSMDDNRITKIVFFGT